MSGATEGCVAGWRGRGLAKVYLNLAMLTMAPGRENNVLYETNVFCMKWFSLSFRTVLLGFVHSKVF